MEEYKKMVRQLIEKHSVLETKIDKVEKKVDKSHGSKIQKQVTQKGLEAPSGGISDAQDKFNQRVSEQFAELLVDNARLKELAFEIENLKTSILNQELKKSD